MNYKILEVESSLFNRNIIQLGPETTAGEYGKKEHKLIEDECPYYIQHQLDAGDLSGIHAFTEKLMHSLPRELGDKTNDH